MTTTEIRAELECRLSETLADFVPDSAIQGAAGEVAQLATNVKGEELGPLTSFQLDTLAALAGMYAKGVARWPAYRKGARGRMAGV
jgi:hypothetical protein